MQSEAITGRKYMQKKSDKKPVIQIYKEFLKHSYLVN